MYKDKRVAIVVPAYNEEKLIKRTIDTMPEFVDQIIVVNDGSKDDTLRILKKQAKKEHRLTILNNEGNQGVGASLVNGFKKALKTDCNLIGVMAGDAQCNPDYLSKMIDKLTVDNTHYVKANRFVHLDALKAMPKYRKFGNVFISLLTKFSTGYYSISDSQNGYGVFKREVLEDISLELIGKRYDYENTLLVALSIVNAKVKDCPVPAVYGDEISSIKLLPTVYRALRAIWKGFWKRIYYKYILFSFHPVALFLFGGLMLFLFGLVFGLFLAIERFINHTPPSTGTVMLAVLPIILGFQLLLTALIMDVQNEEKT